MNGRSWVGGHIHPLVLVEHLDAPVGLSVPMIPGHTTVIGLRFR